MNRRRWILGLVCIRLLALITEAFLPLSLPGIWRQTDTLGVALRYWLRWTVESGLRHPLMPAVLNSGDQYGIMPMEFPLLNIVFAPAFALGPYWGKAAAMLGLLVLVHGLIFLNYRVWKDRAAFRQVDPFAFSLIAVATFSSGWTGKFIPDLISVLLVLLAVGSSWSRTKPITSGVCAVLGLLMKPTSSVVLLLFLAHPKIKEKIRNNLAWGLVSLGVAVLFYTLGNSAIKGQEDAGELFALGYRPILSSLIGFFSDPADWLNMFLYRPFFSLGILIVLPLSVYSVYAKVRGYENLRRLWIVFLIQYVFIAGMGGPHTFGHDYYFLGLAPTTALILWWLIDQAWPKWILAILLIGITVPTLELSLTDLRPLYKPDYRKGYDELKDCVRIKKDHPELPWNQGVAFRSSPEQFPYLGLCFGERQGSSTARFGIFRNDDSVPKACDREVESTQMVTVRECHG